jgi:hypothetical protein
MFESITNFAAKLAATGYLAIGRHRGGSIVLPSTWPPGLLASSSANIDVPDSYCDSIVRNN